jgi:Na+-transporting methylmalonyl-CoA/oxaloacetate decarboxylase gamma subunit
MIEHLINYAASLFNLPEWGGLEVNGFAILMLVLVVLVIVSEALMAIYDRIRETKKEKKTPLPQGTQERIANPTPAMGTH